MNRSKFIFQNFRQWVKDTCSFPESVWHARRRQMELDQFEAERLDRIRNPSKYRGKW